MIRQRNFCDIYSMQLQKLGLKWSKNSKKYLNNDIKH